MIDLVVYNDICTELRHWNALCMKAHTGLVGSEVVYGLLDTLDTFATIVNAEKMTGQYVTRMIPWYKDIINQESIKKLITTNKEKYINLLTFIERNKLFVEEETQGAKDLKGVPNDITKEEADKADKEWEEKKNGRK